MLYRALTDLDIGVKRGELFPSSKISERAIPVLLERGKIAEVAAPPLRDLPVWNDRQPILGVETLSDVVEVDPAAYEFPAQVQQWQKEAKALLNYPAPDGWYLKDPYKVQAQKEDCGGCEKKRKSRARKAKSAEVKDATN